MFGPILLQTLTPLDSGAYVPALRWRQAEYQALSRLDEAVKNRIVPFITIPAIEFDFEAGTLKKTVHEHVHPFVARFQKKWGWRPAWVGLDESIVKGRMNDGDHVFDYVLNGLRSFGGLGIPAVPLSSDPDTRTAVSRAVSADGYGVATVIQLEDLMQNDARARVLELVADVRGSPNETDIIVDMGAPEYEPYEVFADLLLAVLRNFGDLGAFRNFVLVGTAFPESMTAVAKGSGEIPRHDWLFYGVLTGKLSVEMRKPVYGDHTVVHPRFAATMDMRMARPAGKLVYTKSKAWGIRKGGAFLTDRGQMHGHCSVVVNDPEFEFRGSSFSNGDEYIAGCAAGSLGPSTQTRWKEVGINHHMTTVVDDLAKLAAGSSTV